MEILYIGNLVTSKEKSAGLCNIRLGFLYASVDSSLSTASACRSCEQMKLKYITR
jgi:hypothetical protein